MTRMRSSLFSFLLVIPGAFAAGKDAAAPAPAYDVKTEAQFEADVVSTRQVMDGALPGMYLSVKTKGESLDVYLGPVEFIKLFDLQIRDGDRLEVTGSKVKFEGKDLVLGREVRLGKTTLVLRDKNGSPNWLWTKGFPSGL